MKIEIGFRTATKSLALAFGLLFIHWIAIRSYAALCAPPGFWGFVQSAFTVASPPCLALNVMQGKVQELYIAVWIAMGIAVCGFFVGLVDSFRQLIGSKASPNQVEDTGRAVKSE